MGKHTIASKDTMASVPSGYKTTDGNRHTGYGYTKDGAVEALKIAVDEKRELVLVQR